MNRRPRILYLSPCWPHAPTHGGQLRALHIGRALRQVADVRLVIVAADAPDEATRRLTREEFIDLAEELEKILSTKVDLVSKRGLKEDQFKAIEKELRYV